MCVCQLYTRICLNIFYFQEGKWDWTSKDVINVLSLHTRIGSVSFVCRTYLHKHSGHCRMKSHRDNSIRTIHTGFCIAPVSAGNRYLGRSQIPCHNRERFH